MRSTQVMDPVASIGHMESIKCGKEAAKHFLFDQDWRNINHGVVAENPTMSLLVTNDVLGSFGTYPQEVRAVMRHLQDECELRPDKFIRYDFPRLNDDARKAVAQVLNAPTEAIVFVCNATLGINTVLRNLTYKPGDVIIYFSTIYGSCHKTIEYLAETTPVRSKGVQYTYPISDEALCAAFEKTIQAIRSEGNNPKLALFDTIVSLPGVRMPFGRLTQICRAQNVLSCIDGAHSVGQIPMDLRSLDPDFYVSNCHKWLFVPRGCCVMYVPERNQPLMRSSLPTSHGFVPKGDAGGGINNPLPPSEKGEFVNNFEFVGTLDNSPYLCVPAAILWREKVRYGVLRGEEAIMKYCADLARCGGKLVAEELGTQVMDNEEGTLTDCAFANVKLPVEFREHAEGVKIAQWISRVLVDEYSTFIATIVHDGMLWVRLSAQIYLTAEDFEWTGKALKEVCIRASGGEWREKGKARL